MTQTSTSASSSARGEDSEIRPAMPQSSAGSDAGATDAVLAGQPDLDNALDMTELNYYSATESKRLRSRMQASAQAASASSNASSAQRFSKRWANLSLRHKFATLMVIGAVVPTLTVTQALVSLNKSRAVSDAKAFATQQGNTFQAEYVLGAKTEASGRSADLARLVQASGIDPSNLAQSRPALQNLIRLAPFTEPKTAMSFQIVVDIKGRSVAQDIRLLNGNQPVPTSLEQALSAVQPIPVSAPIGQDLRTMPMVQKVLSSGVGATGMERLSPELTRTLQLSPQLQQGDQSLARDGKTLTALSISPVLINGRTRGAVIVGQIINNNNILADTFKLRYDASTAAVFDGQQLVLSTDAGQNGTTARKTEAVVSAKTAKAVLERGEAHIEEGQRDGHTYLRHYSPIYDHKAADDATAKPVGMTYLGQSLEPLESRFRTQLLLAYGLGGSMILLSTLLTLPAASILVKPLKRLSGFMTRLGNGDRGLRIANTHRRDEVGLLALNMNKLAAGLERSERLLEQQTWQNNVLTKIANLRSLDSQNLAEGLQEALEKVRHRLGVDRLVIYRCGTIAHGGRTMYEAQLPGLPSAVALNVRDTCIPQETLDFYLAGNVKANSDVSQAGFGPEHMALLDSLKVKASLIVPVFGNGQLYGLMVAHSCQGTREWTDSETRLMELISAQAASTLAYVTLLEQQREAEDSMRQDKEILQRRALELLQEVDPVSRGDLTVRAKVTPDEIGTVADSYNATVESLRKIVGQVQNVSTQVTSTAQSNDIAVQILAQDALAQAEKITGSLSSIEAMGQSVQQLANQAQEARATVDITQATVSTGEQAMLRTVEGMAVIRESVSETTQKMESLEAASERISNVIRLISSFAAQTHMLAMKASIEAARAGDDGEGFAVIADEVRSLAAQSAQATADVETVINTIQMATQDVITAMEVENNQVAKQMELVEETRASLAQITAASAEVNQLVSAIAQTTEIQTQTSDATASIITEVAQLVRSTSEEASQVSESFKQLVTISQALQAEVAQFKVS